MKNGEIEIGDSVIFADQEGVRHNALVTAVHSPKCINVVHVNNDPTQYDSYGNKMVRDTSVGIRDQYSAHGFWWIPTETKEVEYDENTGVAA